MNGERFAARLRELREAAGLTQQQLAEKAGLTKDGIAQMEQGRRRPLWDTVLALAQALGVDCLAFTRESGAASEEEKRGRGRPKAPPATPPAEELQATRRTRRAQRREKP